MKRSVTETKEQNAEAIHSVREDCVHKIQAAENHKNVLSQKLNEMEKVEQYERKPFNPLCREWTKNEPIIKWN